MYNNRRNNNHSNHQNSNKRKPKAQNYVWVVYNFVEGKYHMFTNKLKALEYYYNNASRCDHVRKAKN